MGAEARRRAQMKKRKRAERQCEPRAALEEAAAGLREGAGLGEVMRGLTPEHVHQSSRSELGTPALLLQQAGPHVTHLNGPGFRICGSSVSKAPLSPEEEAARDRQHVSVLSTWRGSKGQAGTEHF